MEKIDIFMYETNRGVDEIKKLAGKAAKLEGDLKIIKALPATHFNFRGGCQILFYCGCPKRAYCPERRI